MDSELHDGHIVIIGASLAGLRAAEKLREEGFTGSLTVVGDEPYAPYDRPPLSKQVLLGLAPADTTGLPMRQDPKAHWRLGVRATGLDPIAKRDRLGLSGSRYRGDGRRTRPGTPGGRGRRHPGQAGRRHAPRARRGPALRGDGHRAARGRQRPVRRR